MLNLETLHLLTGKHERRDDGLCAMEAVACLAGEEHTDAPGCACPILSAFVRNWNDSLLDADRDRLLKPLLPKLIGTRSTPEIEKQRSYLALDWLIREFTPTWLERVDSLRAHGAALRSLAQVEDLPSAKAAGDTVAAAWAAARTAAARAAAGDAAAGAAAAGAAARAAALYAAAGAAARAAAGDAAGWAATAGAAAAAAAGAAAWAAAGAARWAAAARTAAATALLPTVAILQESALDLLNRMIECR